MSGGGFEAAGGAVHGEHPFLRPEQQREPVRRLRGRLSAPVTLWTAADGAQRAGLTVSSVLVGEPGQLAGLLGDESDVLEVLTASGAFAVTVLDWSRRPLADAFSFLGPAPGGPFTLATWTDTAWGPVPAGDVTWAGCRVTGVRTLGWSALVEARIEHVEPGADADPLVWQRGRYRHLG
ncbi:flavin reductase family protein [Kineococcus glutinatus]|uniref:Flavin reductase family protein n=1 Tax=Kineococcus glutinatus TaxID=1070872 RepID=A0ABP9IAQ1_9ACTN